MHLQDRLAIISGNRLFREMDDYTREFIASRSVSHSYGKGEYLISRGDRQTALVVIVSGVARGSLTSARGREYIFALYTDGDVVELSAVEGETPSPADLVAEVPTLALSIGHETLKMLTGDVSFNHGLCHLLFERYCTLVSKVEMLALYSLRERLARQLLTFQRTQPGLLKRAPAVLSQEKLAFLTNGTRPKVNQHLQVFKAAGAIGIEAGRIRLRDPDILETFASPA
ncbi:Crp/Fnr family transcriptional regulator [Rhodobacterales bacterium]|nr:Crp/Fnr family transcriptional regulator [Rhodobacterales bacterium]